MAGLALLRNHKGLDAVDGDAGTYAYAKLSGGGGNGLLLRTEPAGRGATTNAVGINDYQNVDDEITKVVTGPGSVLGGLADHKYLGLSRP